MEPELVPPRVEAKPITVVRPVVLTVAEPGVAGLFWE